FACPCADCDGEFDLTAEVAEFARTVPAGKERGSMRLESGDIACRGVRLRDRPGSSPCRMTLRFRLDDHPDAAA
ncbi:MAG TPA: hypothetical protein VHV81_10030, partial [Steroidobacteraceae bacterium]|nr:hypothetical protein [Steroidobacteraceae bacterium]